MSNLASANQEENPVAEKFQKGINECFKWESFLQVFFPPTSNSSNLGLFIPLEFALKG